MSNPTYTRVPQDDGDDNEGFGYPVPLGFSSQAPHHPYPTNTTEPRATVPSYTPYPTAYDPPNPLYGIPMTQLSYAHSRGQQPHQTNAPHPFAQPQSNAYHPYTQQPHQHMPYPTHAPPWQQPTPQANDARPGHQPHEYARSAPHLTGEAFEYEMINKNYTLSTTQLLQDAWGLYKSNWPTIFSVTCLLFIVLIFFWIAMVIVITTQAQSQGAYDNTPNSVGSTGFSGLFPLALFLKSAVGESYNEQSSEADTTAPPAWVFGFFIVEMIMFSVLPSLLAGFYVAAFHYIRGTSIKYSHFFQGFRAFFPLFGVQMMINLANNIQFFLGLYASLVLCFAPMLLLEHPELGFFKSISLSLRVVHRNIWDNLSLLLFSFAMIIFGLPIFFVTYPMTYFMYAFAYLYIFGLEGVVIAQPIV